MEGPEFLYKELTYAVIGAAMEVHKVLGPGFLESVYEKSLAHEFDLRQIFYERQSSLKVTYKGFDVGDFRADFVLEGKLVVEIKAIQKLSKSDEGQLLNYLRGTGFRDGLLLNFGSPSLERIRRIV